MYDMNRNGKKVKFTSQDVGRDGWDITLTFNEERDAQIFAGEVQNSKWSIRKGASSTRK